MFIPHFSSHCQIIYTCLLILFALPLVRDKVDIFLQFKDEDADCSEWLASGRTTVLCGHSSGEDRDGRAQDAKVVVVVAFLNNDDLYIEMTALFYV